MPAYLVTDAETGVGVMVDAKRARGAIRAVIESRFTACELEWQEVHALTLKGTRLINAPEAGSDADEETERRLDSGFDPQTGEVFDDNQAQKQKWLEEIQAIQFEDDLQSIEREISKSIACESVVLAESEQVELSQAIKKGSQ